MRTTAGKRKRPKQYTDNLHDQPYDLEDNVFDEHKVDFRYDERDLAQPPDRDEPDASILLDPRYGGAQEFDDFADLGSDANDAEDRLPEVGGKPRPAPRTRQLVQDAGGYVAEVDPRLLWKTATRFYCRACGEWIGSSAKQRIECETPYDPCTPDLLNNRGGCQNCREQRALDLKEARGTGNPPQTCRPLRGEKESRCAKDWRNAMKRWNTAVTTAEKRGSEPPREPQPAEPKWTRRDLRKIQDAQDIAEARAEYEKRRPPERKRQPAGVWDQGANGTGFDARDDVRKPGWR